MATIHIASGSTPPGSTAWVAYTAKGIQLDVNTSAGHFPSTPVYITSLGGDNSHWATIGATSIYKATPTGFRVYVRWVDYGPLTPAQANSLKWYINWTGIV
jgi:hypothetical protein